MTYIIREDDISVLPMTKRLSNCLKRNGIFNIDALLSFAEGKKDWLSLSYLGTRGVEEVTHWINQITSGDGDYVLVTAEDREIQNSQSPTQTVFMKESGEVLDDILIEDMPLSLRAKNILKNNGINRASQLVGMQETDFLAMRNMGVTTATEIIGIMEKMNLQVSQMLLNQDTFVSEEEQKNILLLWTNSWKAVP